MKILFLHQNFPGQFLHLAPALAARGHEVLALTPQSNVRQSPLPTLRYKYEAPKLDPVVFAEAKTFAEMSHRGKAVARAGSTPGSIRNSRATICWRMCMSQHARRI